MFSFSSYCCDIITILGTDDSISPYDGLEWNGVQYYLSAEETHDYWVNYNNTSSQSNISQLPNQNTSDGSTAEHYSWENGNGCVTVEHLKVNGGGHDWPGSFGNMDIDASLEIWNYVSKYNLEGVIGCTSTSVYEELNEAKNIIIYPNPVLNHLTINRVFDRSQVYQIYSSNGKLLSSGNIDSNTKTIDLSTLPQNSYILIIENTILKFIKSK